MDKETAGTQTRTQGKPSIQIKKSTLVRTAKYAGVGAGVLFVGYVTMHSNAARLIESYMDGFLEKIVGIERTIENPADTIEAKIEDTYSSVEKIFSANKNRMGQGLYNGIMFDIKKRSDGLEDVFLQNGKGTEVARYVKEALNP
ncbi:hypothetical protein HZA99_06000, partial [Candidatus Woesearchaeota archaeon]|nr:hypothetical protein [Candidatus Woesearchaeota archaeon]